jgi:hypothetical protein
MNFRWFRPKGPHQDLVLDPLGAVRRPKPPAYFGLSLYVYITSILATPLLRAFEEGGIFIVPHLLWHGTSVFLVSSEGLPHSVASYDTQEDVEDLFQPGSLLVELVQILSYNYNLLSNEILFYE